MTATPEPAQPPGAAAAERPRPHAPRRAGDVTPDLPLLVLWEELLGWLFPALEKMPKTVRFTLARRMEDIALDILDGLVEARFRRERLKTLTEVSLCLERLRTLLRVAHSLKVLSAAAYRHGSERVDEAGRMLGGWIKHQAGRRG